MSSAEPLPAREAYRIWAATYDEETAMNALDESAVARLSPTVWRRMLDAACGTGRRLPRAAAYGVDLVPEMLDVARRAGHGGRLSGGDVRALPFRDASFDLVWCRLALGHVAELAAAYAELARVAEVGAKLVVTDVHVEAARRGLKRTFRDAAGTTRGVAHHTHSAEEHARAARGAGLRLEERLDVAIGPEIEGFFRAADAMESYERQRGLPVLLALRFERRA